MGRSMVLIWRDDGNGAEDNKDNPTNRGCGCCARDVVDIEKAFTTLEGVFEIHNANTAEDNTSLMVVVVIVCTVLQKYSRLFVL